MKKYFLVVSFFLPLFTFAFVAPANPTGFLQDYAGILSPEQVATLENKLEQFEKATTNEIAVVVIPSLDGDTVGNVAQEIFTKWGIGKEGKNNGVLLLVSISDRETRIHTGYGVEGDLTDIETSYIQSEIIIPAFRNEDYYGGINSAVDKMIEALGGTQIVPENYSTSKNVGMNWQYVFFAVLFLFQWIGAILSRSKSWWHGGVLGGIVGVGIWYFLVSSLSLALPMVVILILLGLLFDYVVSKSYSTAKATGIYPWWIGGGGKGGGGFGGGGFGGFGGGMSGGGGSSGRW